MSRIDVAPHPGIEASAMSTAAIVPALDAANTIGHVVSGLLQHWPETRNAVIVVDDGSTDDTAERARRAGALVVCHGRNRGKGAALRTALSVAYDLGFHRAVSVDADGQHPAEEAWRLAELDVEERALVLGIRNLSSAGAPRANQMSNGISNFFLSRFLRTRLLDTQCGLRRYPIRETLALGARSPGYAFEAEILMLAIRAGLPVEQVPVRVVYPRTAHTTHFDSVRDPARIISRVLITLARATMKPPHAVPDP